MSKKECSKAYFNHKLAMEAAKKVPKVSKVSKIFTRKPYSCYGGQNEVSKVRK